MGALAIPHKLLIKNPATTKLCARIGVRIDGIDQGTSVISYDIARGEACVKGCEHIVRGKIEPYWR